MARYIAPRLEATRFTCPQCGTLAEQHWGKVVWTQRNSTIELEDFRIRRCMACDQFSFWSYKANDDPWAVVEGSQLYPYEGGPPPHDDMPADAKHHFEQARKVLGASPQAAAALLRVATESIVHHLLGRSDSMLNEGIGQLVAEGKIRTNVQQACDVLRVTGNNVLHPGQIDPAEDHAETAERLFALVNLIVEQAVTEPALVQKLHASLPKPKLDAIARRDKPKASGQRDNPPSTSST